MMMNPRSGLRVKVDERFYVPYGSGADNGNVKRSSGNIYSPLICLLEAREGGF
jgi:hypothetical protein